MCVVLQSSLGGAGSAEKEAGKLRAGMQRAQADCREAGKQGRAQKKPLPQPRLVELEIKPCWDKYDHQLHYSRRNRDQQRVGQGAAAELPAE